MTSCPADISGQSTFWIRQLLGSSLGVLVVGPGPLNCSSLEGFVWDHSALRALQDQKPGGLRPAAQQEPCPCFRGVLVWGCEEVSSWALVLTAGHCSAGAGAPLAWPRRL